MGPGVQSLSARLFLGNVPFWGESPEASTLLPYARSVESLAPFSCSIASTQGLGFPERFWVQGLGFNDQGLGSRVQCI